MVAEPVQNGLSVVQSAPVAHPNRGPRLGLPTAQELATLLEYGQVIVKSGLAPAHIKTPEAALVIMRQGHQLGIDEFTAMQNMFVVGGKPSLMASLMHALILNDHGGSAVQIVESTSTKCELLCKRRDATHASRVSYTIEEAKQADLKDGNWLKYPTDMLFARCISRAGRQVFRDSTMGMYTPEELGASIIEVNGEVIDTSANQVPRDEQPRSNNRLANLHRIGMERGLDHEALHRIAFHRLNTSLGDPVITDMMLRNFEHLIETSSDEDLVLWQMDWQEEIRSAEQRGMEALKELGKQIKLAGITSESHRHIAAAFQAAVNRLKNAEPVDADFTELPGMPTPEQDRFAV